MFYYHYARLKRYLKFPPIIIILMLGVAVSFKDNKSEIPKTWDVVAIKNAHLPPPDPGVEVRYAPESYYVSLPEHVIYKTYPVYVKEFEPAGYLDSLRRLEPEVVFDLNQIKTQEDWIKAGEKVFFWPPHLNNEDGIFNGSHLDSAYLASSGDPFTKDGIYPYGNYVITEKGKVRFGDLSCANCHTRVTDEGELIVGAQGNHAFDPGFAYLAEKFKLPAHVVNPAIYGLVGTPWALHTKDSVMSRSITELVADLRARPNGVMTRQGMAYNLPLRVPSLIGVQDIKYLDITGLMKHDGPADLMRYAALNQGMDMLTSYDGFIPLGTEDHSELPQPQEWNHAFGYDAKRYTDAQLYALTQFIYSLRPPENPNQFLQTVIDRGEQIFKEQGCVTCHTPPLYTNNMLTPVDGFEPPEEHLEKYDIFNVSVETDPQSSLASRRGTGYYKIPSLRGVWYRSPFFHNGQLATLEDVFDPDRLKDDYVPTGYKPARVSTQAVKGHDFGMELSVKDKEALISYLKTL